MNIYFLTTELLLTPSRKKFTRSWTSFIEGMLKEGDHAVTTTIEHNSVLRPLYHLNKYNGVEVDYNIASRTGLHCAPLVHEQLGTAEIHGAVRILRTWSR